MKMIYVFILVGTLILLVSLVYLIRLNYNDKIPEQIFTFILSFIIVSLGSIAFSLKSVKIERSFFLNVVVKKSDFSILNDYTLVYEHCKKQYNMMEHFNEFNECIRENIEKFNKSKTNQFQNYLIRLEGIADLQNHKTVNPSLDNQDKAVSYYLELLQYKIITDIRDINWKYYATNYKKVNNIKYFKKRINIPYDISDSTTTVSIFLKEKNKNKFFESHLDKGLWENPQIKFPENITFTLSNNESKREIIFKRNLYFNTVIEVEFNSFSNDAFPEGLIIDDEISKDYMTLTYLVKCSANFDKISSLGIKSKNYQEWTNWLFDNIIEKNN